MKRDGPAVNRSTPQKLRGALARAAHKRDISAAQIAGIVDGVKAEAARSEAG